jgi:hypothetical protein
MARSRSLASSWLALALLGCADSGTDPDAGDDVGDGDGDVQLPEHDAELRCPAGGAPQLAAIDSMQGLIALGPCGHLAYHDAEGQGWRIEPDGTRTEFEHVAHRVGFAPTGDLLAWDRAPEGGLMIRDLLGGSERLLVPEDSHADFGFVPSFGEPTRGAWLWTCTAGLLERHDVGASEAVASDVVCGSVTGSTGSPRLTFADIEGRVWLADLDEATLVGSDDHDHAGFDGSSRDDTLWIDHDGEVVLHAAIEWQGDDDSDSDWPVPLWSRVIDREGGVILDEPTMVMHQAPRRGAPVFVLQQGEIRRLDAGAPSSVAGGLEAATLAGSGELFWEHVSGDVLAVELDLEQALIEVGQFTTPVELRPSQEATMLAVEHHSDICILDDLGECDRILLALRLWDREAGLDPRVLLSSSPWNLEATMDDGSMLVVGAPVEAEGPTYDGEQPSPRVLWLDRQGEIRGELPAANGDLAVRQTIRLGDERVLFEYQGESGQGELMVAKAGAGFVSLVPDVDVALLQAWVDGRGERVAFVAEANGGYTLWFGALP